MTRLRRTIALSLAAALLAAATFAAASRLPVAAQRPYDLGAIPSSKVLRLASLGHASLAANVWWLRAVQYMGEPRADARGWEKLHPAVDLVTDLDPLHGYAYQVAGNVLGAVGRVAESNALLEKGTRNVPTRYILPFHRAVNAFLYEGDYALAGRWFERAAAVPGAPSARMREYAVAMYVKGDAHATALTFLSDLLRQAEDEDSRKAIRKQLQRAVLERDADLLERAAKVYLARYAFPPIVPFQLVTAGIVSQIPPDPFGGTYYFDDEGRVRSSADPHRFARPLTKAEREEALSHSVRVLNSVEPSKP